MVPVSCPARTQMCASAAAGVEACAHCQAHFHTQELLLNMDRGQPVYEAPCISRGTRSQWGCRGSGQRTAVGQVGACGLAAMGAGQSSAAGVHCGQDNHLRTRLAAGLRRCLTLNVLDSRGR